MLGPLFFPKGNGNAQSLASLATFGIAFVARPVGSVLFGHFGDRLGRKTTLVASLLTMGLSTMCIGLLPTFAVAGALAPVLLCLMRLGQGIGLGGEWGGAALVATENAPAGRQAWFGMFPQLGPPIGYIIANGLFMLLVKLLSPTQFQQWGWRIPFLFSAVLVAVGLIVRTRVAETPAFVAMAEQGRRVRVPLSDLFKKHLGGLTLGSLAMVASYGPFYIATIFSLDYGTRVAGIARQTLLGLLCIAIVAMAVMTLLSARLAQRFGCRNVLLIGALIVAASGLATMPLLGSHAAGKTLVYLLLEFGCTGLVFAPMGALLPSLFPPHVRYTGAAAAYSIGGILGASIAPYIAQILLQHGGLPWVGYYVTLTGLIGFVAAALIQNNQRQM